jgi:hypothetical protein
MGQKLFRDTGMSEWSHLPNARHIDWVIADVRDNPDDWSSASSADAFAFRNTDRNTARKAAAWVASRNAAWIAVQRAAWDAARPSPDRLPGPLGAYSAALQACLALIAYDYAGALFDRPVEQVRVQAYLGQPAAILMLPACRIKEKRRELIALS